MIIFHKYRAQHLPGCTLIYIFAPKFIQMKRCFIPLLLGLCLAMASCTEYSKVINSTDLDYKYKVAQEYYNKGQYARAAVLLQDVIQRFKGTENGEESLYMLGMSQFGAKDYNAAATVLQKYYQTYPHGKYAEKAMYQSGLALYNDTPEPKLDQTATYAAISEFQNFIETYPESDMREKAQEMIFALQDKLVEKEYISAKLYYDLGDYFGNCSSGGNNYEACVITAQNALKDYPYTTRREEFAILILRAKFHLAEASVERKKAERYHDAIDEYYGFTNEYPESKYLDEAHALYNKAKPWVESSDTESTP